MQRKESIKNLSDGLPEPTSEGCLHRASDFVKGWKQFLVVAYILLGVQLFFGVTMALYLMDYMVRFFGDDIVSKQDIEKSIKELLRNVQYVGVLTKRYYFSTQCGYIPTEQTCLDRDYDGGEMGFEDGSLITKQ